MRQNILCIMERTQGETVTRLGYQHFLLFPSMEYIKRIANYHTTSANTDTNDSGQSAYIGTNVYQVSCDPDVVFIYNNPLDMNIISFYQHSAGWGPTGIAILGNYAYILAAATYSLEIRDIFNLDKLIKSIAYDNTTYGEHDGITLTPHNTFLSATSLGYIVEFDKNLNYINNWLIDSTRQFRGTAIYGSYLITCDVADQSDNSHTNIYILNYPSMEILEIIDFSSHINTVGNRVYGSFFIDDRIKL